MKQNISILLFFILTPFLTYAQEGYAGSGRVTGRTTTTIVDPASGEDMEVTIQFINGNAVLDGDIILGPEANFSSGRGGTVTSDRNKRWSGAIPYFLSVDLPQGSIDKVHEAERILESQTNLRLTELTAAPTSGDYIQFNVSTDGICASFGLGKMGGMQIIVIDPRYRVGSFIHEILHAVGFLHEQNRTGRDTYITVHFDNIKDDWKDQYRRATRQEITTLSGYDYESIMHYGSMGSTSMAIDATKPLITVKNTNATERARLTALMGNRDHLSAMDIASINRLFPTAPREAQGTDASIESGGASVEGTRVSYTFPGSTTPTEVVVNVVGGRAILDGDIVLGMMEELGGGRGGAAINARSGNVNRRWPNCTMPYDINDHRCSTSITSAIHAIDSLTNLSFIPRTNQPNYIQFAVNDLNGVETYDSPVGMQSSVNTINISPQGGCPVGTIMHEILHSAGLFHEQSRKDRDKHVRLNRANLRPGKIHNFQKYTEPGQSGKDIGPYDYASIMHYPSTVSDASFVINTSVPIFTSIPPGNEGLMGSDHMSAGDINTINTIYTCGAAVGGGTALTVSGDLTTGKEHTVPLVPQTANYSSFDACASMMISWIYPFLITSPAEISGQTGFWNQFVYNVDPTLPISFVQWGMQKIDPKQYTPSELFSIVNISPIVVVPIGTNPVRARLIYGMKGDGTPAGTVVMFHDALDRDKTQFSSPNNGYSQTLSFQEFMTLLGSNNIVVGKF
jgi:hypothetical protein